MGFLVALGVIVVVLGVARWRFNTRLPVAAVAAIDCVLYWAMLIMTALGLTGIILFTALKLFDYQLPQSMVVPIYLVSGVLVWTVIRSVQRRTRTPVSEHNDEPDVDRSHWPISGPIGRFGPYGLMATFYSTQLLCLFNPFQVVELIRQAAGNATLVGREKRSGADGRSYETRVVYTLPFEGEWLVANGGATPKTSHSWDIWDNASRSISCRRTRRSEPTRAGERERTSTSAMAARSVRRPAGLSSARRIEYVRRSSGGASVTSRLTASSAITYSSSMPRGSSGYMPTSSVAA